MATIELPAFSDLHVHFREPDRAAWIAPESGRYCGRVLAMPNLRVPVDDAARAASYLNALDGLLPDVDVMLAVKLMPHTTPETVRDVARLLGDRAPAFKLYPAGVTTQSADGIGADVLASPAAHPQFCDVLGEMERLDRVLCLHGESPTQDDPLLREPDFLPFADWVLVNYPKLRVVLEHITTEEAVQFVRIRSAASGWRLAATITAHHLVIHLGHVHGSACSPGEAHLNYGNGKFHPHLTCWPVAKQPKHRNTLRWAATHGGPCFFLGSDSAPHPVTAKECADCCAGIFSAPVLPEALAQQFEDLGAVDKLPAFVAHSGDAFYRRKPSGRTVRIARESWVVPDRVGDSEPFLAGRTLRWKMV